MHIFWRSLCLDDKFILTMFFFPSGLLPPGTQFDLFRGTAAMKQDEDDMYPATLAHTIKARNL